eukprot:3894620-Pleurochrysis_carterae.AAC.2
MAEGRRGSHIVSGAEPRRTSEARADGTKSENPTARASAPPLIKVALLGDSQVPSTPPFVWVRMRARILTHTPVRACACLHVMRLHAYLYAGSCLDVPMLTGMWRCICS